jgi:hypothetical protein
MSNYVKATNFTAKDSLPSGNSGKIIKGAEIDTELTAVASAISSKADLNSPALTGTPTAPTAAANTNTTQVATTAFVQSAIGNAITGIIVMWSGSIANIPTGWALCNGSNGTPDLRNRFIIGAHSDNAGVANTTVTGSNTQTGGSKDAIVVSHSHTATSSVSDPGHNHTGLNGVSFRTYYPPLFNGGGFGAGTGSYEYPTTANSNTNISVSTTVATTGSSGTDANLPPYYALAFIMKT